MERFFRIASWACVLTVAVLSLLPGQDMVRTSLGGHVEHALAYAGTAFLTVLAYNGRTGARWPVLGLLVYAGVLEFLQRFSPGRTSAVEDFLASATGVLIGLALALAVLALWRAKPSRA